MKNEKIENHAKAESVYVVKNSLASGLIPA